MSPTLALAIELIRRPSVTPADGGCQAHIAARLARRGFTIEHLRRGEVENLWARHGETAPLFVFAGHTDVVPAGPRADWRFDPFAAVVEDGWLYGRGAADMKGSLAAMVTAAERFVAARPGHAGSLAFLLTSDEEGPAIDGTARIVETLAARGVAVNFALVGEPSSDEHLGDVIRNGRRGSLGGTLVVRGVQGHVAYPERARNPIHVAVPALAELCATQWDAGNAHFPPTSFQISNVHAGTGADNVIPGRLEVLLNFRYGSAQTAAGLQQRVAAILARHGLDCTLEWRRSGEPFLTPAGVLLEVTRAAVRGRTGIEPRLSTGGGTSDGRFIATTGAEVVELGPVNATIHKVDERVAVADLDTLSAIYEDVLSRLLC
ncbi:MAG: succinyl-diaminopimelate desuccinylase [Gammaproteobacteria bacterium]|nr:succinyl-diaminopimelate desuccinylase [Gammaproteobacteria bacterium]